MRIAIKYDDIDISSAGRVAGHEAGDTLVRRLLRGCCLKLFRRGR